MGYLFSELIDIPKLQSLMNVQYAATGIPIGIIGIDGTIHVAIGWQDICTKFHRVHPETARRCKESDNHIADHLHDGGPVEYRCKNGLWDIAVPICIKQKHVATLFVGQFHYENEVPDRTFFISQAEQFNFDRDEYLAALDRLPVFSRSKMKHIIAYYSHLVDFLMEIGLNRIEKQEAAFRLQKSEERFSLAMNVMNEGLWDWNVQTNEVYFGPNYLGMLGYQEGEDSILRSKWQDLIYPADRSNVLNVYQDCIDNLNDHFDVEFRMLHRDGEWIWIRSRGSAVSRGDNGRALRVISAHENITERKRAEEERNKVALRYQTLQSVSRDGIHILDPRGNLVESNAAFREMLGYSAEFDLPLHASAWVVGIPAEQLEAKVSELIRTPAVFETKFRDKNGTVSDVEISACGVQLGDQWYLYASARDVSKRKQIEASLLESRQFLSDIFDFLPDATFVVDREKTVIAWNRAMEEMSGVSKEEMLGRGDHAYSIPLYGDRRSQLIDLIDADDEELRANYQDITRIGERLFAETFCPILRNGKGAHVWAIVAPLYNHEGTRIGAIESIRDITAIKEAEANLARSNRELELFAYVASHDLQEPLRKISGFTELLANRYKGAFDEKAESYMEYIVDGAVRMRTLINDLLNYSRVMNSNKEHKATDCSALLDKVLRDMEPALNESNAEIVCGRLPVVQADPAQLGQLFQNLISNAIKYRGTASPKIRINAFQQHTNWLFSVADNGIGIAPEFFERIFVIFQRLHTRAEYPGTGIGLAVCQKIIEHHGGKIWIESTEGSGSTFFFTLPIISNS